MNKKNERPDIYDYLNISLLIVYAVIATGVIAGELIP